MRQFKVKILENKRVMGNFLKMRIDSPYLAKNMRPGQFVQVRCSEWLDPLLRRPFSVHRILKDGIEILYEVVGKGTETLSRRKNGEFLDVIGPLGNGFKLNAIRYPLPPKADPPLAENAILVAGGMGVAPLVALAEKLAHSSLPIGHRKKKKNIHVIIGAKTKSHILCETEFPPLEWKLKVATKDGSKGYKGLATDLLKDLLSTINYQLSTIYACGPNAMLKEVAKLARARRIPCQVSLEEYMACGVGVCLGCPVRVKTKYEVRSTMYEYKMVCKDGPVFNAEEIAW